MEGYSTLHLFTDVDKYSDLFMMISKENPHKDVKNHIILNYISKSYRINTALLLILHKYGITCSSVTRDDISTGDIVYKITGGYSYTKTFRITRFDNFVSAYVKLIDLTTEIFNRLEYAAKNKAGHYEYIENLTNNCVFIHHPGIN